MRDDPAATLRLVRAVDAALGAGALLALLLHSWLGLVVALRQDEPTSA